jgi:hypothetical protein
MSVLKESTVSLLADVLVPTVLSLAFGIFTETLIKSVLITYYLLLIWLRLFLGPLYMYTI